MHLGGNSNRLMKKQASNLYEIQLINTKQLINFIHNMYSGTNSNRPMEKHASYIHEVPTQEMRSSVD